MNFPAISIVIPAFNEANRLPGHLRQWLKFLPTRFTDYEIIVVDDGSTDNLSELLSRAQEFKSVLVTIQPQNAGKGSAVKSGMALAKGDLRLFCDADGSTPVEELDKMIKMQRESQAAIVIGSRIQLAGISSVHSNLIRHYIGRVFTTISSLLSGLNIYDTQCGFKLFTRESAEAIFPLLITRGFAFDVEVLMRAEVLGFPIAEVPISWNHQPGSKVRVISDGLKMLRELLIMRFALKKYHE